LIPPVVEGKIVASVNVPGYLSIRAFGRKRDLIGVHKPLKEEGFNIGDEIVIILKEDYEAITA
jgi:hypothetical protein